MSTQTVREKTAKQIQAIFALAKKHGFEMDEDGKAALAATASQGRIDRLSFLTFDEANVLIKNLGGDPFRSGKARRTVNHQRQEAGVVTMVSPLHLQKLDKLAEDRNISPEGLERLCLRMLKVKRPNTAKGCNAVIEALKSMNKRDRVRRAA